MELSNIQSALASLEERFHKLRVLGEQQLQKHESTIAELRQQLAESIGEHRAVEAKLESQNTSHEQELAILLQKLEHRNKEVDHLRIRCELLLQQSRHTKALEDEAQQLKEYIQQCDLEDQELCRQLNESLDENRDQVARSKDLQVKLNHARRVQQGLASLLSKERHLFTRLLQLHQ
jgi:DNA repair exonuclease SbcCD ATPase subunit